jgi:hypothetical protein
MTIDWNGAVLDYCKSAFGKRRGATIQQKLWYLDNRSFFAMRGFTSLGWFRHNYPNEKAQGAGKAHILQEMHDGDKALDEIIRTATALKKTLNEEIKKFEQE